MMSACLLGLVPGDSLLSVAGAGTAGLSYGQTLALLAKAPRPMELIFEQQQQQQQSSSSPVVVMEESGGGDGGGGCGRSVSVARALSPGGGGAPAAGGASGGGSLPVVVVEAPGLGVTMPPAASPVLVPVAATSVTAAGLSAGGLIRCVGKHTRLL